MIVLRNKFKSIEIELVFSDKKVMVIGAETLSRICDPHDRDSMIYSDGAGAVI
ncbi:hypothetical protein [Mucilaginibacter sp.]|uniref:hypothetical protein n=1 Tax=Mucilaginibacter sp. TaxID=1882438 RepID=UPI0026081481|nr:hypothetical protein [Mucilaginibacter sp.]MDB5127269.1 3-oxoacyl-[acyl-carrier-protein] synthase [Mucilaginibacter sp.]